MNTSSYCLSCLIQKQEQAIRAFPDETKKAEYLRLVLKTICEAPPDSSTPYYTGLLRRLYLSYWHEERYYEGEKEKYNRLMLQKEDALWEIICDAKQPLVTAIQLARAGNYIDFGALSQVQEKTLDEILNTAYQDTIDETEYRIFTEELSKANHLLYLTDNCGEIVLDKLLIRLLSQSYPNLKITAMVRGEAVLNDATLADANLIGLNRFCDVTHNGTDYAGTVLSEMPKTALEYIDRADIILSKGQGNFESLHGCGKNIYYLLLCKCDWFVKQFGMTLYSGVFQNERRLMHQIERK